MNDSNVPTNVPSWGRWKMEDYMFWNFPFSYDAMHLGNEALTIISLCTFSHFLPCLSVSRLILSSKMLPFKMQNTRIHLSVLNLSSWAVFLPDTIMQKIIVNCGHVPWVGD